MAVVRKTILLPGKHVSPVGETEVTPARSKRFQDKFRELKAAGVEFGVPWSHVPGADPNAKAFLASKLNAGYIKDLEAKADGELVAVLDCPGLKQDKKGGLVGKATLPDGKSVDTVIKEVSAGIWPSWTDGKGNTHTDIIGHVALTTNPVITGMGEFMALATNTAGVVYLSTTTLATEKDDDKPDPKEMKDDIEEVAKPEDDKPKEDDLDSILAPNEAENKGKAQVSRLVALLAKGGVPLPADTCEENILERLEVAIGVLLSAQEAKKAAETPVDDPMDAAPIEEPPPTPNMMMSTLAKSNPVVRKLLAKSLADKRSQRSARIEALKRRGLPVVEAGKLMGAKVYLSTFINPETGDTLDDSTDRTLSALEASLPKEEWAKVYLSTVAGLHVNELPNPAGDQSTVRVGSLEMTGDEKKNLDARLARLEGRQPA